jgi:hypothetical protein
MIFAFGVMFVAFVFFWCGVKHQEKNRKNLTHLEKKWLIEALGQADLYLRECEGVYPQSGIDIDRAVIKALRDRVKEL